MGLQDGYVVCNMNIDNSETHLVQQSNIVPKDTWTKVHLQRFYLVTRFILDRVLEFF